MVKYIITFTPNGHRREVVVYPMPGVIVRDEETFEKALKRFKKACEKAGIISDMKKHQHFEKPSERKKRKINAAKRKRMKLEKMFRS